MSRANWVGLDLMSKAIMEQLKYLFDPPSIAVLGASNNFGTWGYGIMNALLVPAQRRVYPVTKSASEVFGLKAYKSILEIPDPVDLAVIALPMSAIPQVMQECVRKGVKAAHIIAGGLAEASEEGARVEEEIVRIARQGGIRFVGPNSMGYMDTSTGLCTVGWTADTRRGPIGFVSQSGTYGQRLLRTGIEAGMGFSKFISSGNEADLHLEDYLEYMAQDEETRIIAFYMEGLREGRRFLSLAREVTREKPIIVMKTARTQGSAKAAKSHTAALAGEDTAYDALFKQSGIIRVDDDDELFDVTVALLHLPRIRGRRVGILTEGGGLGVVAAEACEQEGLEIPALSPTTMEKLDALLPPYWSHGNPVDMTDVITTGKLITFDCLWTMMEDENVDAVMLNGGIGQTAYVPRVDEVPPSARESVGRLIKNLEDEERKNLDIISGRVKEYQKPLVACRIVPKGSSPDPKAYSILQERGIPIYPNPHRAARALRHLAWYGEYLKGYQGG